MNDPRPLIIYHADCADGFTAAWVARRFFMRNLDIEPELRRGIYGQGAVTEADCAGREVYLLDFSYRREHVESLARVAKSLTVLDHHESAWKEWGEMGEPGSGKEGLLYAVGPLHVYFRRDQSGAMMAWMHFNPNWNPKPPERSIAKAMLQEVLNSKLDMGALTLVSYVQDRDLWKFELPDSRAINAWIFSYEYTTKNWDIMADLLDDHKIRDRIVSEGAAIERKHLKDIREFLDLGVRPMTIGGVEAPTANIPYHWGSDAGHVLLERFPDAPFAATYFERGDGQRVFGLRSRPGGTNVAEIARALGGGGHPNAAGFSKPRGWDGDPEA